jgi:hypothetical protein
MSLEESSREEEATRMAEDEVTRNLKGMDELDFTGWNGADWNGVFAHYHTDDVLGRCSRAAADTRHSGAHRRHEGVRRYHRWHARPGQVSSDGFGSGEWTCVVGEFEDGGRMVTVAKWRDGAIAEEYIWM